MNNSHTKILLIEDNPGDARLIQELLSDADMASFKIEVAERLSDGLDALSVREFDVVLLDLSLPDSSGLETLAKAHAAADEESIIVLTGLDDEDLALEAVRKGAQDYLVKGRIDENVLCRAIRYAIERKRVEEEKKKLEGQLLQAQKMEALGTLAGGIAHDFNNLLMGIQGRVSLMFMKTDSDHPHFAHLTGIEDAVEKGAELAKQLLGLARGGKYEVIPTDLNHLIKNSSDMFGRTKKEIRIHKKYGIDLWTAEVDRGQIEQVLLNLYVNAWQAMPEGGDLYIETRNVTLDKKQTKPFSVKPGNYVKLSVTDTGIGMDEATRQRVFEPFFTTREMGGGTGLGLASAYGIIKNHGGMITVQSEPGHGTTFDIHLPASGKRATEKREPSVEMLGGTETVLLVDDEATILHVAKEMLTALGYRVMLAGTAKQAIELYTAHRDEVDVVVLDMIMPDMSGGEVYDKLKEINPKIKVLLSSGYSLNGQADAILQRGCDGFIQKPFNVKQLSLRLREILDKQ